MLHLVGGMEMFWLGKTVSKFHLLVSQSDFWGLRAEPEESGVLVTFIICVTRDTLLLLCVYGCQLEHHLQEQELEIDVVSLVHLRRDSCSEVTFLGDTGIEASDLCLIFSFWCSRPCYKTYWKPYYKLAFCPDNFILLNIFMFNYVY